MSISTVGDAESHPGPGKSVFSPNGGLIADTWQHIAGVYDGRKMRIFINGQDACVVAQIRGGIQNNTEVGGLPSAIGRDNVNDALRFAGLIDDLRIYPRALDRTELANGAFAGDDPIPCPTVVPAIPAWGFPLAALLMLLAGSGALLAPPRASSSRES